MQTGIVFDIQRCCLDDGPGLRTTVFLKGCPLTCLWCHNPESQSPRPQLSFDYEKCVGCGRCVELCPCHVWVDGQHTVLWDQCTACGKCRDVCPEGALDIKGREYTVGEVLREVRKDEIFYRRSGGGVTLSGGEPCAQPEFLAEILKACRELGIHTAVETSGAASRSALESIVPYTDLFLWDYKATENSRFFIGADSQALLKNMEHLLSLGGNVRLRCPIIPGVGDNETHLSAIAALSRKYGFESVEILPYHNMGIYKSKKLGRTPWDEGFANMSAERKQWIKDILTEKECVNFRIL